jgi:hypothetical protein
VRAKNLNIVIGARLLKLLKRERWVQLVGQRRVCNRQIAYGATIGYIRRMAMRIAKNESVHAIWLKLNKMPRFMFPSWILIVTGAHGRCCQENSAKCEDL